MLTYTERLSGALKGFDECLADLMDLVRSRPADPVRLPRKALDELISIGHRAGAASKAIGFSLKLIAETELDLVDMYRRLREENAHLASALKDLGEMVAHQHFIKEAFSAKLVELDEEALTVAAAVFPSAVEGLRPVNVKLWEFREQKEKYQALKDDKRIAPERRSRIEVIGTFVIEAFETVNAMLNQLAEGRATEGTQLRQALERARKDLISGLAEARSRMTDDLDMFKGVVNDSTAIANDVVKLLDNVVIPIFPLHHQLGALTGMVDARLYDNLSGVQAFALLNIAARMQATEVAGRPVLSSEYGIKVDRVFPDRIYFNCNRELIDNVNKDKDFEKAPASLHKFNDGSFKQHRFMKGNLQLSFEARGDGRVDVDADLDLYRAVIPHLFGEVLVNHLKDSRTNQFSVFKILDQQGIASIGGFTLMTA